MNGSFSQPPLRWLSSSAPRSAWTAMTSPVGLGRSLCTSKESLHGGSSNPHQLPGGDGEDRSVRRRMKTWFPNAVSGVQTHVPLKLINLTWKSYWEGKGCFNLFNSFPSSLFLLFQRHLLSSVNALQIIQLNASFQQVPSPSETFCFVPARNSTSALK